MLKKIYYVFLQKYELKLFASHISKIIFTQYLHKNKRFFINNALFCRFVENDPDTLYVYA